MEQTNRISQDVAEAEFDRFIGAMDLDVDAKGMDDEDKKSYEVARRKILNAMLAGHLVIDPEGQPVYMPRKGNVTPIVFHEPTGASLMAMDQRKKHHDIGKMYALMADMTKQPAARFAGMHNRDLQICLAVTGLFLG